MVRKVTLQEAKHVIVSYYIFPCIRRSAYKLTPDFEAEKCPKFETHV